MKKRTIAIALVVLLAIAAVPTIAFASAQGGAVTEPVVAQGVTTPVPAVAQKAAEVASTAVTSACPGYADANGDGVCDSYATGACTGYGCSGQGFVDANNDGVCDNYAGGAQGGQGCGWGAGYVDTDGNGTCDNYDAGACPGNGSGHGHGLGNGAGRGHHGRGC